MQNCKLLKGGQVQLDDGSIFDFREYPDLPQDRDLFCIEHFFHNGDARCSIRLCTKSNWLGNHTIVMLADAGYYYFDKLDNFIRYNNSWHDKYDPAFNKMVDTNLKRYKD